jgi:hypothetical protein
MIVKLDVNAHGTAVASARAKPGADDAAEQISTVRFIVRAADDNAAPPAESSE